MCVLEIAALTDTQKKVDLLTSNEKIFFMYNEKCACECLNHKGIIADETHRAEIVVHNIFNI